MKELTDSELVERVKNYGDSSLNPQSIAGLLVQPSALRHAWLKR